MVRFLRKKVSVASKLKSRMQNLKKITRIRFRLIVVNPSVGDLMVDAAVGVDEDEEVDVVDAAAVDVGVVAVEDVKN